MTDALDAQDARAGSGAEGFLFRPVVWVGLCWIGFQLLVWLRPDTSLYVIRAGHVCFGLATFFAVMAGKSVGARRLLALAGIAASAIPVVLYYVHQERLITRYAGLADLQVADYAVAMLLGGLLIPVAWFQLGAGMVVVVMIFVIYQIFGYVLPRPLGHSQGDIASFIDQQFLTNDGLLGIPLGVSVNIIFYFVLFATVFEVFGGSRMIIQLALAVTGRFAGGPAKAAVVGSAVTGLVSGSAVSNVMTSGIFTIPLMIKTRYPRKFAAAVEAVVSTGGQLVPPVMGAAAFIMADFLQLPYHEIVMAAALPAALYFLAMFVTVHFKARMDNLATLNETEIENPLAVLRHSGHLLLPLIWLAGRISTGYPIPNSCVEGIVAVLVIGSLVRSTRQSIRKIIIGAAEVAVRAMPVALACALAGIIVGVVSYSGLGNKLTSTIVDISQTSLTLAVVLTIAGTILLGMGMPTTSAYIMSAILLAPALIELGFDPLAAHMLVFYFAILAMVTPPIALSAYAAASIADAPPGPVGWTALRLSMPVMLIPVLMIFRPAILLRGSVADILIALVLSLVIMTASCAASVGWFGRKLSYLERGLFVICALSCVASAQGVLLLLPGAGAALVILYLRQKNPTTFSS